MSKQGVSERSRQPGVCCCQVPVWADSVGGLSLRNSIGQTQTNEAAATVTQCSNEPAYWLAGFLFLSASMSFSHSLKHTHTCIHTLPLSHCLSLSAMFVWIPAATRNTNYCRTSRGVRRRRGGGKRERTRDVGNRLGRKKKGGRRVKPSRWSWMFVLTLVTK